MKVRPLISAASCAAAVAVVAAALMSPSLPTVTAQAPAPMDTVHLKALYAARCSACHSTTEDKYNPSVNGYTRRDWQRTVRRMMGKPDSGISPAEADAITSYLVTLVPRDDPRGPADPWATDTTDVWTVAPSATHVFNFEASNPLAPLSQMTAGESGPAAVWHSVPGTAADGTVVRVSPVKPSPTRFALLVDRADQGRNLDVKVRFQIQGGTVSPAVGIAFGVSGPKSYDVLRFDALHNTLSLLKIDEPTHTPLQQTSVSNPAGTAHAANAAPAKLSAGWHTLRLLVKDGQVRGWVDMEKRVSVQDAAYAGGRVALWTQGDTVAVFDDWTVDLYDSPPPPPATNTVM